MESGKKGDTFFLCNNAKGNGEEIKEENIKAGNQKGIGRIEIAISKELTGEILGMERANGRITKIRLATNIRGSKITILNTYAPHMCYNTGGREEGWAKIGETLKAISNKDFVIWGTDNNGQVAQENKGKQGKNKSVGNGQWRRKQNKGRVGYN